MGTGRLLSVGALLEDVTITLIQLIFEESCSLSSLAFSDFVLETAKDENPSTSKSEEHRDAETPKR